MWKRPGLHFEMDLDVTPIEGEINLQLKVAPWLYFFCLIIYVDFVFFAYVLQNVWFHTLVSFVQTFHFPFLCLFFGFYFLLLKINLAVPRYHF